MSSVSTDVHLINKLDARHDTEGLKPFCTEFWMLSWSFISTSSTLGGFTVNCSNEADTNLHHEWHSSKQEMTVGLEKTHCASLCTHLGFSPTDSMIL